MRTNLKKDKQIMNKYIVYGVYYKVRLSRAVVCHIKAHDQTGNFVHGSYTRIDWIN